MDARQELIETSKRFVEQVKDLTPGTDVELWLNREHGPGTPIYDKLATLIKEGVRDGWAANVEVGGPGYRRSRIADPSPELQHFSITAVYIDSNNRKHDDGHFSFRGEYHAHPYGELNMVVPLDPDAKIAGPNGWCGPGWTAPGPGSHHYPEVKDGALIALFFLPAGRISYAIKPPVEAALAQPSS